jgi:hypothetical protein
MTARRTDFDVEDGEPEWFELKARRALNDGVEVGVHRTASPPMARRSPGLAEEGFSIDAIDDMEGFDE